MSLSFVFKSVQNLDEWALHFDFSCYQLVKLFGSFIIRGIRSNVLLSDERYGIWENFIQFIANGASGLKTPMF